MLNVSLHIIQQLCMLVSDVNLRIIQYLRAQLVRETSKLLMQAPTLNSCSLSRPLVSDGVRKNDGTKLGR